MGYVSKLFRIAFLSRFFYIKQNQEQFRSTRTIKKLGSLSVYNVSVKTVDF